jgi:hypothetical protein
MTLICAVHNKCQGRSVAVQQNQIKPTEADLHRATKNEFLQQIKSIYLTHTSWQTRGAASRG